MLVGQGSSPAGAYGEYFATSPTPVGPFKFRTVQTVLSFFVNGGTGDQTTFQDDGGKAYVICWNVSDRSNLYVAPLRASDFLALESTPTRVYRGSGCEGNAMFKHGGVYYFCSSDLHGWNASHTYCLSSTKILGPYNPEFVLDCTDADFSHVAQTGFFVSVQGTKQNTMLFAGDRWSDFAGNGLGYNQWVPLSFNGTTPRFHSLSQWNLDAATGEWSVAAGNNYVLNPSFEADRVAQSMLAGWAVAPIDAATINSTSQRRTGRFGLHLTGSKTVTQTISGLPNGTYDLSVWAKSSGGQSSCQLFAKGFGGSDMTTSLGAAMANWTQKTIRGVPVSNGTIKVGIQTSGSASNWVSLDDFELVRVDAAVGIGHEPLAPSPRPESRMLKVDGRMSLPLPGNGGDVRLEVFRLDGRPVGRLTASGTSASLRGLGLSEGIDLVRALE